MPANTGNFDEATLYKLVIVLIAATLGHIYLFPSVGLHVGRLGLDLYEKIPAFVEIFDEESWYIFATCFCAGTICTVFILSKFITLEAPVDY